MTAQIADALAQTFKDHAVLRIAIVDDGYDEPELTALNEQDWLAFTTAVDEAEGKFGSHKQVLDQLGALPSYGDLRDEQLQALWDHHTSIALQQDGPKDEIAVSLSKAFSSFSNRKLQKLRQLRHVEQVAERATGAPPAKFSSAVTPVELQDFDLVFLDFFLGDEVDTAGKVSREMLNAAENKACKLVSEITDLARQKALPLFVVISSLASNDNVPAFRDKARLLGSKFRFLSKNEIELDVSRRDFVLRSLVSQRAAGDAVELLTNNWQKSIEGALQDMMASVRRLDIADYAYIQDYRLSDEKVSLLNYLTWVYNGYLGSFVEERLTQTKDEDLAPLTALVSKSAILRPMSEVPRIYSRITTTKVVEIADGQAAKVWTGDIFVRKARLAKYAEVAAPAQSEPVPPLAVQEVAVRAPMEFNTPAQAGAEPEMVEAVTETVTEAAKAVEPPAATAGKQDGQAAQEAPDVQMPDVIATVTPVCDLVPGRINAKHVVLVGGELTELAKAKEASNHLLVYERKGVEKPVEFVIKWDNKSPISFPIGSFDGEGIKGTDYVHVTRLRELYAAEVAQGLASDLARVGVPIAPPFTRALDVVVWAAKGKQPILSTIGGAERPYAWDVHAKKKGFVREVVFSEEFLWALIEAVKANYKGNLPILDLVSDIENIEGLLTAFDNNKVKHPTKLKEKLTVKTFPDLGEALRPSNEEFLAISLFDA